MTTRVAALRETEDLYLECRDLRHSWKNHGFYHKDGEIRRNLQCVRCGCIRTDRWTRRGKRLSCRYEYPEGYVITGEGRGIKPKDVRIEVLSRVQVFGSEDEMYSSALKTNDRKRKARK